MTDPDTLARRLRAAQDRLQGGAGDAIVLFPSTDLTYLAGFEEAPGERHLFLFVPAAGDPVFFVPELYDEQVRAASPVADVRTWADDADPTEGLATVVADLGLAGGHVLLDDHMWALFSQDLRAVMPDATFGLASEVLATLRVRKDEAELAAMRAAADAADATVADLRAQGADVVGTTEAELAAEIERLLAANGGTGVSFETIVGSGPNGAMPHHHHSDREIEAGDPVVLDFGTRVDGYPSDQTRTLVFDGDPGARFREVHEVVREAQQAAVDAVAPEVIEAAGYGEEFVHRTGHGVGLDVHEEPYIVAGSDRELEPGMVFSVEPGVYRSGEFGVRIEDLVVVTQDGCERLNQTDRGWRV